MLDSADSNPPGVRYLLENSGALQGIPKGFALLCRPRTDIRPQFSRHNLFSPKNNISWRILFFNQSHWTMFPNPAVNLRKTQPKLVESNRKLESGVHPSLELLVVHRNYCHLLHCSCLLCAKAKERGQTGPSALVPQAGGLASFVWGKDTAQQAGLLVTAGRRAAVTTLTGAVLSANALHSLCLGFK